LKRPKPRPGPNRFGPRSAPRRPSWPFGQLDDHQIKALMRGSRGAHPNTLLRAMGVRVPAPHYNPKGSPMPQLGLFTRSEEAARRKPRKGGRKPAHKHPTAPRPLSAKTSYSAGFTKRELARFSADPFGTRTRAQVRAAEHQARDPFGTDTAAQRRHKDFLADQADFHDRDPFGTYKPAARRKAGKKKRAAAKRKASPKRKASRRKASPKKRGGKRRAAARSTPRRRPTGRAGDRKPAPRKKGGARRAGRVGNFDAALRAAGSHKAIVTVFPGRARGSRLDSKTYRNPKRRRKMATYTNPRRKRRHHHSRRRRNPGGVVGGAIKTLIAGGLPGAVGGAAAALIDSTVLTKQSILIRCGSKIVLAAVGGALLHKNPVRAAGLVGGLVGTAAYTGILKLTGGVVSGNRVSGMQELAQMAAEDEASLGLLQEELSGMGLLEEDHTQGMEDMGEEPNLGDEVEGMGEEPNLGDEYGD
jgi:hypothetical protein